MILCERCGEENSSYTLTCKKCGKYLRDEQTLKIITLILVIGAAALTAYWGELDTFVGGILSAMILLFIGVEVAKVDFTSFLKLFQASAAFAFLSILSTEIHSLLSIAIILALPFIIKIIYNTTWKKTIIAVIVYVIIAVILRVVAVVIAVIVYGWASQFLIFPL